MKRPARGGLEQRCGVSIAAEARDLVDDVGELRLLFVASRRWRSRERLYGCVAPIHSVSETRSCPQNNDKPRRWASTKL